MAFNPDIPASAQMLLHLDDGQGATTFVDSLDATRTYTSVGAAEGQTNGKFDGDLQNGNSQSGDTGATSTDNPDDFERTKDEEWYFGIWVYPNAIASGGGHTLFSISKDLNNATNIRIADIGGNDKLYIVSFIGGVVKYNYSHNLDGGFSTGAWNFVEMEHSSDGNIRFFSNGIFLGKTSDTTNPLFAAGQAVNSSLGFWDRRPTASANVTLQGRLDEMIYATSAQYNSDDNHTVQSDPWGFTIPGWEGSGGVELSQVF